ncbi:Nucleoside-diphosphate-sugar epimerase [Seinonella peptonophila]|uniref:Nucleoside-diphosphate-sugar epimerase n=1 Tax=Seinonella peptonophila TaxID=112248 RepID=A0A1M4WHJ3_9BACL|nr:NAD(P)-dependent oxidoreductase [Seinonella peptonophila]SHE80684.1 Nucleoside-diphosphate-sugar epimerase [Seinonella peptonophila]
MKALVTGATGFLGQKLVNRLKQNGYIITATGRNHEIGKQLADQQVQFIAANLDDQTKMESLCQNQEMIFHCGARSAPWGDYEGFYQSNVLGTRYLLQGALKHHVKRFIHVSTPSIYFQFEDRFQIKENDPLPTKKVNAYAETKWLAEQEVDQVWKEHQLPTITIRPRAIFGPGDQTIIPRLLRIHERGSIPLIEGGQVELDITYVENVVDALLLCASAPESCFGKKYNITNGEPKLLIDLLQLLFQRLGEPLRTREIPFSTAYRFARLFEWAYRLFRHNSEPPITRYTIGVIGKSQTLDIAAAKEELGYHPNISIEEGIDLFIRWWKNKL